MRIALAMSRELFKSSLPSDLALVSELYRYLMLTDFCRR